MKSYGQLKDSVTDKATRRKGKGKLKRKGTEMDTDRDIRGQQRQVPRLGCLAKIAEGGRATSYSTTSSKDSEMMEI